MSAKTRKEEGPSRNEGESIQYFAGEKWHVLECHCGERIHFQPIVLNDSLVFCGPGWSDEWDLVDGAWKCWNCLGKPKPQRVIDFEIWVDYTRRIRDLRGTSNDPRQFFDANPMIVNCLNGFTDLTPALRTTLDAFLAEQEEAKGTP